MSESVSSGGGGGGRGVRRLAGKLSRPHEPEKTHTACSPEHDFVERHWVLGPNRVHGFEDGWCDRKSLGPWTTWYTPVYTLQEVRQAWKGGK